MGSLTRRRRKSKLRPMVAQGCLETRRSGGAGHSDITGRESEEEVLKRYTIPPSHRHKVKWDFFIGVLIFYSSVVIPFRVSFGVTAGVGSGAFFFDLFVDISFLLDML